MKRLHDAFTKRSADPKIERSIEEARRQRELTASALSRTCFKKLTIDASLPQTEFDRLVNGDE